MSLDDFDIQVARSAENIGVAGDMFREYQEWLGVDLCFQDFENELSTLPGKYAPPRGEIFIATLRCGNVSRTIIWYPASFAKETTMLASMRPSPWPRNASRT